MMTQEEYMDVLAMKRQGMSFKEIGDALGYHPATISKWIKEGGPPAARTVDETDRVIDPVWADRLTALLVGNSQLLATSLFEIIAAVGLVTCGLGSLFGLYFANEGKKLGDPQGQTALIVNIVLLVFMVLMFFLLVAASMSPSTSSF